MFAVFSGSMDLPALKLLKQILNCIQCTLTITCRVPTVLGLCLDLLSTLHDQTVLKHPIIGKCLASISMCVTQLSAWGALNGLRYLSSNL